MGRMYAASFDAVAVSVAQDLFEINAPADAVVVIHSVMIGQTSDTDSEQLQIKFTRSSTSGSGGSTLTPAPLQVGAPAFGGTVEANNTTQGTEGTILKADAFNVLSGYCWVPTPEERIVLSPSGRLAIEITAPADALTMSGTVVFEEIGG